ncbi:hypothetical protein [Enhygromyxa salina]|uniref:Uncharacterized protein n=1 Tax=Enhygromyxa salina TaxID=215803 RepID=A0A2S9YVT2_9BACT|nr:hypothetical protein [Enhygromyxa salina]PRQ09184.1 hypothetical protein ENSA7_11740 [Enhygromyxa salina]
MNLVELAMVSALVVGAVAGTWIGATAAGPLGALAGATIGPLTGGLVVSVVLLGIVAWLTVVDWWNQRHSAALLRRLLAADADSADAVP